MTKEVADRQTPRRAYDWLKFLGGLLLIFLAVLFFASGYSPPGAFGEVLRHNQDCDIDASPLFYSEVENMQELEQGLQDLRASAHSDTTAVTAH